MLIIAKLRFYVGFSDGQTSSSFMEDLYWTYKVWNPFSIFCMKADVIDSKVTYPTLTLVSNYSTSSQTNLALMVGLGP